MTRLACAPLPPSPCDGSCASRGATRCGRWGLELARRRHQRRRRLVQGAPNIAIAGLADASLDVDRRAGLPPSRGQAEVCHNIMRATEARRIFDRRHQAQRRYRTYAESPSPTELVPSDEL